jgi:glycosyltransferase involved in cell wall biosynthesis
MIYVCIPSHNEAATIGLVLWKIRKIFQDFPREYQILVVDDGSTDATPEILEPYNNVLSLTVIRHPTRQGYARSVEELLTLALARTDRPKRDSAVLMHGDFAHGPEFLPDFVRRLDSGADMVVGEATLSGEPSRGRRLVRRFAPLLLRRAVRVPGVQDIVSGFVAFRLMTLKNAIRQPGSLRLSADGWAANAELIGRAARHARRIETVPVVERHDLRRRESRIEPWVTARQIWRAGSTIRPALEQALEGAAP